MKHYKSVEDLINEMEICQTTYAEALLSARYFDREVLNLRIALDLALEFFKPTVSLGLRVPPGKGIAADKDYWLAKAVEQINKYTCPICQEYMEQTECLEFIAGRPYHQACWLSRPRIQEGDS